MKKEWMYFIAGVGAGAGLTGAIMFFTMPAEHSTYKECVVKEVQKFTNTRPYDVYEVVMDYCKEQHAN
tara:strand:- start:564 stop:767 length:204 start_codon:yes stop_codon:yes gene_type:complete